MNATQESLTPEQEKQVLDLWNKDPKSPPGLKQLTQEIFGGEFDGRSWQGKAIKSFLLRCNLKAKVTSDYFSKTSEIQLTDDQKQFIVNNIATMNSLEISKILFNNQTLSNLNAETRAVNEYVKSLDTRVIYNQEQNEDIPTENYQPPATLDKVLKRVNKYVNCQIDKEKLTAQQKKGLEMLINYLHTYRFIRQMNTFESQEDRNLCEDSFVRYTYDKPDLTQEEIDQYIELSNQTVRSFSIKRRSELMQSRLEEFTSGDPEAMKVSMGLVEAIGKAGTEYDQCLKRCNDLLYDLKEKRSTRLSKQIKENASILNLVQMWRDEEQRIKLLKLGELEQRAISNEVEKISDMSEIKARILGLSKEDILNG
jgi:hypothetical protein